MFAGCQRAIYRPCNKNPDPHNDRVKFSFQLPAKLNELDQNGDLALDLALSRKLESIATTLVSSRADVDMVDKKGWSLLHKAIHRGE